MSANGNVIAIGAAFNGDGGINSGHVRIYENIEGNWMKIGDDINGQAEGDQSGASVSLSADGNIVAIGAPLNDDNGSDSGQVRIYENASGNWIQLGGDINGEAIGDQFGFSVSLSSNGSFVAIGAPVNDGNGVSSGHVRIYKINQTTSPINWEQLGQDIDSEDQFNFSGRSVNLNADGNIVAIGAPLNNDSGSNTGHVRVYKLNETVNPVIWEQLGQDIDGEAEEDFSGWSISLSSDGSIIAIGSRSNDGNGDSSGHVRIYKINQTIVPMIWEQLGQDIDGEAAEDESGISVSLSADGNFLAIGAPRNSDNGSDSGQVRIYTNISDNWTQFGEDINGESSNDQFGTSVSLSSNGNALAIGAPSNDNNDINAGQVRVYDLNQITLSSNNLKLGNDFRLYPNPANSEFTINTSNTIQIKVVNIYNNLGQLVLSSLNKTINALQLSSGLYIVEIETSIGRVSKKIIVE